MQRDLRCHVIMNSPRPNPEARAIVAMLLRRFRSAQRDLQRASNSRHPATYVAYCTAVRNEARNAAEYARRILYRTPL